MKRILFLTLVISMIFVGMALALDYRPHYSSLLPDMSTSIGTFRGGGSSWGTYIRLNFSSNDRLLISGTDKLLIK